MTPSEFFSFATDFILKALTIIVIGVLFTLVWVTVFSNVLQWLFQ